MSRWELIIGMFFSVLVKVFGRLRQRHRKNFYEIADWSCNMYGICNEYYWKVHFSDDADD